jgi:hypothetical protein
MDLPDQIENKHKVYIFMGPLLTKQVVTLIGVVSGYTKQM